MIRSDYGYHVVYFCGTRSENYEETESGIQKAKLEALVAQAMEAYPMEVSYDQITLLPAENQGKLTLSGDLLYPDVAHERITEIPVYIQQDYLGAPYGTGSVSSHGCGITTLAMLSTYMADDYLTPGVLAAKYRDRYSSRSGTDAAIFQDAPPELGYFLKGRYFEWDEPEKALQQGYKVVSLQYKGYFTRGGHFLALSEIDDQGNLTIRDSNVYNYRRLPEHMDDSFPHELVFNGNQGYWVYDYKLLSLPNCSRCGDVPSPLVLAFSHVTWIIDLCVVSLCLLSTWEMGVALGFSRKRIVPLILQTVFVVALLLLPADIYKFIVLVLFVVMMIFFAVLMTGVGRIKDLKLSEKNLQFVMIPVFFSAIKYIRVGEDGLLQLALAILVCSITDSFAYLVGRKIGKHKLAPKISPSKTIEGSIGGTLAAAAFLLLLGFCLDISGEVKIHYGLFVAYLITASLVGQFGDLCMSSVKRIEGIKDYSDLLPGHGGILDRFDSQLFVLPYTYLFCAFCGKIF